MSSSMEDCQEESDSVEHRQEMGRTVRECQAVSSSVEHDGMECWQVVRWRVKHNGVVWCGMVWYGMEYWQPQSSSVRECGAVASASKTHQSSFFDGKVGGNNRDDCLGLR